METKQKVILGLGLLAAVVLLGKGDKSVRPLNQGDPSWKSKRVGNGSDNYGNIGCVCTAVTMTVNALRGTSFTPDDLMPGAGAGLNTGDYDGSSIKSAQVFEKLGCVQTGRTDAARSLGVPTMCSVIDTALGAGQLVVLRVDYDLTKAGTNHSVVCFKKDAGHYVCADPAGGVIIRIPEGSLILQRTSSRQYTVTGIQTVAKA
jgi:hypothetical protein